MNTKKGNWYMGNPDRNDCCEGIVMGSSVWMAGTLRVVSKFES